MPDRSDMFAVTTVPRVPPIAVSPRGKMNRSSRVLLLAVLLAVYPAQSAYSDSLQSFLPDSDVRRAAIARC